MKLYEYQAKHIFSLYNIPFPEYQVIHNLDELETVWNIIKLPVVLKAQSLADQRGRLGGIKIAYDYDSAKKRINYFLNYPPWKQAQTVLIEKAVSIQKEYFISFVREKQNLVCYASIDLPIEELSLYAPQYIIKKSFDNNHFFDNMELRKFCLELSIPYNKSIQKIFNTTLKVFENYNCSLIYFHPIVQTQTKELLILDIKMNFEPQFEP